MATTATARESSYRLLVGGLAAVLLLSLLFLSVDTDRMLSALAAADLTFVGLAAVTAVGAQLCWGMATATILRGTDESLSRRLVQLCYLSGTFGKLVLPLGNAGGSAIIAYVLSENSDGHFRDLFGAVAASELLIFAGSLGGTALGLTVLLLDPPVAFGGPFVLGLLTVVVLALLVGGAVVYHRHRVAGLVERVAAFVRGTAGRVSTRIAAALEPDRVTDGVATFLDRFGTATNDSRRLAVASAFALLGWLSFSSALLLGLAAVDVSVSLGLALFLVPAAGVLAFLPTPGGLGTTEVGLTGALVVVGIPPELAAAGVVVFRLATYWLVVAVGGTASLYLSVTVWRALE
ncbi:lysylphosphatidylglycerol synthase transmembrane domain-containing protein [Haloarcula amylovorans]|uniref:lysylphosphatidylglycerol synthase transmembrane domain-containing protein n=1 Tax=Haloarcula amylovorans TaxID=2562280 RepID=UPI0010763513|nr:lysylphosphatidylglycerol synthase transmembrane domain-containing protein [Halomicroarcula amylolytica]